jgi:hypothetical protein
LSEFRDTYSLLCEVIDVTIPGTAVAQIGENHLKGQDKGRLSIGLQAKK